MSTVLVRVAITVMKYYDQSQVVEERVYLVHTSVSLFIIEEVRTWMGQNSGGKSWCRGYKGCCLVACSPWLAQSFLLNPGSPAQGWHHPLWAGPSHINHESRKMYYRFAHKPIWWRDFLNSESLSPNDSSLYQVDIKLARAGNNNSGIF